MDSFPLLRGTEGVSGTSVSTDRSGNVVEVVDYFPFGDVRLEEKVADYKNDYKFTGKELDDESGLYYYGARYYDSSTGRFISVDPWEGDLTDPQTLNKYAYVFNNPLKYIDPNGESGTLTIYANGGGLTGGHAWITFTPDDTQETTSYGTWGNNPSNRGDGLLENEELNRDMTTASTSRTMHIDDSQEEALLTLIQEYKDAGDSAWKLLAPCSAFAQDAWETGTGEYLDANTFIIINNPQTLSESIIDINGGQNHNTVQPQDGGSSSSNSSSSSSSSSDSSSSGSSNNSSSGSSNDSSSSSPNSSDRSSGTTSRGSGESSNPSVESSYRKSN